MNFNFDINNYNKNDFLEIFSINKDENITIDIINNKHALLLNNIENSEDQIAQKNKIIGFINKCKINLINLIKHEEIIIPKKNFLVENKVNPIKRKTEFKNLHFNSKYRKDYYTSSSSNYQLTLPESCNNVISMKLSSIAVPNTWYVFSDELKNNRFIVEIKGIASPVEIEVYIPDGNYAAGDLETFLNETYFEQNSNETVIYEQLKYITFQINPYSLKCIFKFTDTAPGSAEMNLIFSDDSTENIMMSAGWILGFRYGRYFHIKRNSHLMSEGIYDGGGDRYLYFCLKDFQRNINTPHIVYFEDSTIRNDILAKINLVDGKFAINIDEGTDDVNNHAKTRQYFGPVHLKKFHVRLIDQYGNQINLNNMDFSFSLEIETLYNNIINK